MYAALHHQGRRLHELARQGIVVERAARTVTIERLELLDWSPPLLTLDIMCSKGTYIRSLARDLGEALECGAHLEALRRTAVGLFLIEDAVPLTTAAEWLEDKQTTRQADQGRHGNLPVSRSPGLPLTLSEVLLPPEVAVADWPAVMLGAEAARRVRNGLALVLERIDADRARAHGPDGQLLALLVRDGDTWKPEKVFDWN
jgi:tRNA pseudouridine55 synthase